MFTTTSIRKLDTERLLVTGPMMVIAVDCRHHPADAKGPRADGDHPGHADHRAGVDRSDRLADGPGRGAHADRHRSRRDHHVAALLRLHLAPRALRASKARTWDLLSCRSASVRSSAASSAAFFFHYYGEVKHQPSGMWWVIIGVGVLTAILLLVYDRVLMPQSMRLEIRCVANLQRGTEAFGAQCPCAKTRELDREASLLPTSPITFAPC